MHQQGCIPRIKRPLGNTVPWKNDAWSVLRQSATQCRSPSFGRRHATLLLVACAAPNYTFVCRAPARAAKIAPGSRNWDTTRDVEGCDCGHKSPYP